MLEHVPKLWPISITFPGIQDELFDYFVLIFLPDSKVRLRAACKWCHTNTHILTDFCFFIDWRLGISIWTEIKCVEFWEWLHLLRIALMRLHWNYAMRFRRCISRSPVHLCGVWCVCKLNRFYLLTKLEHLGETVSHVTQLTKRECALILCQDIVAVCISAQCAW